MRYGPSTNTLMTADEYARLDRIRAHALMSSVSRTLPAWSDESTPRTDRPVRFVGRDRAWGALGMPFTYRPDSPCPKCGIVRFPA